MCASLFSRYRFDELGVELFSDSDRLSFTSLSRSSSLIQFESLERQLQSDSQISGSSPSIYSYEGVSSTTQELEKSAPIAIAINLPTIKVSNPPPPIQFTNSDSEPFSSGSTSGSFSSDDSNEKVPCETTPVASMNKSPENRQKYLNSFRAKNSVDSLSEDSGYCDREPRSLPPANTTLPTGRVSYLLE